MAILSQLQVKYMCVYSHFVLQLRQGHSQDFTLGAQKLSDEGARNEGPQKLGLPPTNFWHI